MTKLTCEEIMAAASVLRMEAANICRHVMPGSREAVQADRLDIVANALYAVASGAGVIEIEPFNRNEP